MSFSTLAFTAFTVFFLAASPVKAREYKGEVVSVTDGDTLTMRAGNNRRMTIRLADIDAPEKLQPYGIESKQSLMALVQGEGIIVDKKSNDRYKRTVGTVYRTTDAMNVNREQTLHGNAWAYRQYLYDPVMLQLEDAARTSKIGLWGPNEEARLPPAVAQRKPPKRLKIAQVQI